ncbi:MAG: hypothetical protein QOE05_1703 [Actinomycetota bacterium]|nr:hypothetical protein [Actinomycetota bacterium]
MHSRFASSAVTALVVALCVLLPSTAAQASCVPPEVTVTPSTAAPGQRVTLSSHNWFGICNDTGQKIDVTDVAVVTFVEGSLRRELGRTHSDASGFFRLAVRVPGEATAGRAVLQVRGRGSSDDVPLTVTDSLPLTGSSPLLAILGLAAIGSVVGLRSVSRVAR